MAIDRTKWPTTFTAGAASMWRCPSGDGGTLVLQTDTLKTGETSESLAARESDAWEPEWLIGNFSSLFACSTCKGFVAVAGTYRLVFVPDPRMERETYYEEYTPRTFVDAPALIPLPEYVPFKVRDELRRSFPLFWSDHDACAGRIRTSVERLLDHFRVRKTITTHEGRRKFVPLHDRIVTYRNSHPEVGEALLAVKWIGNAGAHSNPLTRDDVFDGYDIMEYALRKLFDAQDTRVQRIARKVNGRRGPRSARNGTTQRGR
jgi:Domain of unknown function (DUF4145)